MADRAMEDADAASLLDDYKHNFLLFDYKCGKCGVPFTSLQDIDDLSYWDKDKDDGIYFGEDWQLCWECIRG